MIGKKVKVIVGNDNWGEVINPDVPYLVVSENDTEYFLSPTYFEFSNEEIVKKGVHKFSVNKDDVKLW